MKNNKTSWDKVYKEGRKFTQVAESTLDDLNLQGSVLEVGCGEGELIDQLKERGLTVRGIDLSGYSADMVGNYLETELPKFDNIIANLVLAFNPVPLFLKKVHTDLKSGGKFVLITPVIEKNRKYSEHWKGISVDREKLLMDLEWVFGRGVMLLKKDRRPDGEILTFVCTRK